jgi:hypothetical protein
MKRRDFLRASTSLVLAHALLPYRGLGQAASSSLPLPAPGADGWVSLLNGRDLTGWYSMLQKSGKGFAEAHGMVTMEEEMLHILGNEEGLIPA